MARATHKATFYTHFLPIAEHLHWLDDTAGTGVFAHFSWLSPAAWSFWCRDRELYRKYISGLFSPAIWRLFDMGKRKAWPGARKQIIEDNMFFKIRVEKRKTTYK